MKYTYIILALVFSLVLTGCFQKPADVPDDTNPTPPIVEDEQNEEIEITPDDDQEENNDENTDDTSDEDSQEDEEVSIEEIEKELEELFSDLDILADDEEK